MNIRLDAVGVFVQDVGKMVEFYRDVLGLEIAWDGKPYAEFKHNGIRLMLFGRKDFEKLIEKELSYPSGVNGTFELAIDLPRFEDVDVEFKRVVDLGATPVYLPKDEVWGMRSSYVADPEGNLIEIGSWGKGS